MRAFILVIAICGCDDPQPNNNPGATGGGNTNSGGSGGSSSGGGGGGNSSAGGSATCAPSSPGALFGSALCLCGSLHDIGNLIIDGPGSASAAVDGVSRLINHTDVGDRFVAYGGLSDAGDTAVHKDLLSSTNVDIAGNLVVDGDLALGGNLSGFGRVKVGGTLRVAGADQMIGWQDAPTLGSFTPLGAPPCPCDAKSLFDVAAAVAAAKANSIPLSQTQIIGVDVVQLASGAYYSGDSATIGYQKLRVSGAVSLFIEGNLDEIGADRIVIDPGASLDLYVSGGVRTVGYAGLGDAQSPSSFRLYVGGASPVTLSIGAQWFHGSIYAPKANLVYVGDTHVAGGLFANELVGTGQIVIGGALPGSGGGNTCPPTPPDSPPVTPTPIVG